MALYYYNKYNVVTGYAMGSWSSWSGYRSGSARTYYTSYSMNPSTGEILLSGATPVSSGNLPNLRGSYYLGDPWYVLEHNFDGTYPGSYRERMAQPVSGVETQGSLVQSNILAENGTYPTNGKHTDGYWYVRGSQYVPPNYAPSMPGTISAAGDFEVGKKLTVSWGNSTDPEGLTVYYELTARLYKNGVAQSWATVESTITSRSASYLIPNDNTISSIEFRVRAYDSAINYSGYRTSTKYTVSSNNAPTITLNTTDNRTLYENDVMLVDGTATDTDVNNNVLVKYQINSGTVYNVTSQISTGSAIPFNKSLTFKQNKLYDGTNEVTPNLVEGTQNTLKVWAEDDKGGKSAEVIRTFYVVPNRPATLTMDPFTVRNDLIDSDVITISGNVSDPDNNSVVVKYKISNGSFIEVYSGQGGAFSFQVQLANLAVGANTITVQAVDSYGATASKTLNVTKSEKLQPLLTADTRYRITPPNGTATGAVLWLQREVGDLAVTAEISMTAAGEPENYVPMTLHSTAFVTDGIEEDEFRFDSGTAKEVIMLKLTQVRTSPTSTKGIKQISGVLT